MTRKEKKQNIRETLLERRSNIPETAFLEKSARIHSTLKSLPEFKNAQTVHCYVSINERREVNTQPLIREMLAKGKRVVVPITDFESNAMRHVLLEDFGQLKENKWGVMEPAGAEEVPVSELDLVIVPMVGGGRQKNRIGYGKGFYDRFLENITCPKVGLLFDICLIDEVPVEPFDVTLSTLITETKIIE